MKKREYTNQALNKALDIIGATTTVSGHTTNNHQSQETIQATFPDGKILVVKMNGDCLERQLPTIHAIPTDWAKDRQNELELTLFKLDQHTQVEVFEPLPEEFNISNWIIQ